MYSHVQRLVKLILFIMHLNEFFCDNALLILSEDICDIAFHEKDFCKIICAFLEKEFNMRFLSLLGEGLFLIIFYMS